MNQRRAMSPVIHANVKLSGDPPVITLDVRFSSRKQLCALIRALEGLLRAGEQDYDHVHLQDASTSSRGPVSLAGTEVMFFRPGSRRTDIDLALVRRAGRHIRQYIHRKAVS